jgi:hypothetical protein
MQFTCFKAYFYRLLRIGVYFIKHDIQGVFLKCAEILPTRLFDNLEDLKQLKKNCSSKNKCHFIF